MLANASLSNDLEWERDELHERIDGEEVFSSEPPEPANAGTRKRQIAPPMVCRRPLGLGVGHLLRATRANAEDS